MNEVSGNFSKIPHCLSLDNREKLILNGVSEVDNFDDKSITTYTTMGTLIIKGERLNIKKLSLELGELEVTGKIDSLVYSKKECSKKRILSKIFNR